MCMLTSIYPTRELNEKEVKVTNLFLSNLLIRNSMGNRDGVGFASPWGVVKWERPAETIVVSDDYKKAIVENGGYPLIAHVRAISTGQRAREGAHPFLVNGVAVAHNGTLLNYQKVMKDENIDLGNDPVDSHVFTAVLAKKKPITAESITDTIKLFTGSFAFLIYDYECKTIWVVRGSNSLYQAKFGPLVVINTSEKNLQEVAERVKLTQALLGLDEWEIGPTELLEMDTIYRFKDGGELEKVASIPRPKPTVVHKTTNFVSGVATGTIDRAVSLAEAVDSIPGVGFLEAKYALERLHEKPWYDVVDPEAALAVLKKLSREHYQNKPNIEVAEIIWNELVAEYKDPYDLFGEFMNLEFPWFMNDLETLDLLRLSLEM